MENSIAQQLINKFNEHGSFIDLYEIAEAFNQDKNKSLIILSEFLTEQDAKNKSLLEEVEELKSQISLLEVQLKSSKQDVEMLKFELKAADSVNERLFTLDDMKKACGVGVDICCKHNPETGNDFKPFEDLINQLKPNQPK